MRATLLVVLIAQSAHGANILFIGDSHSNFDNPVTTAEHPKVRVSFGDLLLKKLSQSHQVTRVAVNGAATTNFLEAADRSSDSKVGDTGFLRRACDLLEGNEDKYLKPQRPLTLASSGTAPCLKGLLKKVNPDVTIVAIGSNEILPQGSQLAKVLDFLKQLPPSKPCLWIGPPAMHRGPITEAVVQKYTDDPKIEAAIRSKCTYFKSSSVTKYPDKGDGLHYWDSDGNESEQWAQRAYECFSSGGKASGGACLNSQATGQSINKGNPGNK